MKVEGKIEIISVSANQPKRFSLKIEGKWYSIFTEDGVTNLKKNDIIEAEYTQKGIFRNIDMKSINILGHEEGEDKEQNRIEKQACLKASAIYSKDTLENIRNAKILYNSLEESW